VTHNENNSPILLLHGSALIRIAPRTSGAFQTTAVYARSPVHAATLTPVEMVRISTTPSTHVRSVVWRTVKPNELTMSGFWFLCSARD
jgi:hypothetical protein